MYTIQELCYLIRQAGNDLWCTLGNISWHEVVQITSHRFLMSGSERAEGPKFMVIQHDQLKLKIGVTNIYNHCETGQG